MSRPAIKYKRKPWRVPNLYTEETERRFWAKVGVAGRDDCWPWLGAVGGSGKTNQYGRFKVSRWQTPNASRVAWELHNHEDLGERFACHTCDNTLCCNPHHIYAGDHSSNTKDAVERKRFKGRGNKVSGSTNLEEVRVSELSD